MTRAGVGARGWVRGVAWAGALFLLVAGLFAFVAPVAFFEQLAVFEPYNEHFIHDIGAFQVGLGAVLALAALRVDGLAAALLGVGVGAVLHALAHVLDRDLGGSPATDIPGLGLLGLALLVAGTVQLRDKWRVDGDGTV